MSEINMASQYTSQMPRAKNIYSLLFRVVFPIWLLWQLGWHLAFNYWLDYRMVDFSLLVSVKLGLESVFFAASGVLIYRKSDSLTLTISLTLIVVVALFIFTMIAFINTLA